MLQTHSNSTWATGLARTKRIIAFLLISALVSLLTACGNGGFPSNAIVEQAIARQVKQVQAPLSRQLKLPAPALKDIRISHLQIRDRDTTTINGNKTYHLRGLYDLTLKQKDQQSTQSGDAFDVFLQPQVSGKTTIWQLAQSAAGGQWRLEPLSTPKG